MTGQAQLAESGSPHTALDGIVAEIVTDQLLRPIYAQVIREIGGLPTATDLLTYVIRLVTRRQQLENDLGVIWLVDQRRIAHHRLLAFWTEEKLAPLSDGGQAGIRGALGIPPEQHGKILPGVEIGRYLFLETSVEGKRESVDTLRQEFAAYHAPPAPPNPELKATLLARIRDSKLPHQDQAACEARVNDWVEGRKANPLHCFDAPEVLVNAACRHLQVHAHDGLRVGLVGMLTFREAVSECRQQPDAPFSSELEVGLRDKGTDRLRELMQEGPGKEAALLFNGGLEEIAGHLLETREWLCRFLVDHLDVDPRQPPTSTLFREVRTSVYSGPGWYSFYGPTPTRPLTMMITVLSGQRSPHLHAFTGDLEQAKEWVMRNRGAPRDPPKEAYVSPFAHLLPGINRHFALREKVKQALAAEKA